MAPTPRGASRARHLTARQSEVANLVAHGYTNDQIARELGITERGVRAQVSRLLKRFGSRNRTALARVLLDDGVLERTGSNGEVRMRPAVAIPPDQEARLYDGAPFMVAVMSAANLRITYVNERFAKALGWRAEHLVGGSYADVFSDAPPDRLAARHRAAHHGELKTVDHGITKWKREDGTAGLGVLTYMVHPLWTIDGTIDELLFVGFAQGGDRRTRGSPRSSRSDGGPSHPDAGARRRTARATVRGLRAA